ncbi:MAG: hypothetical protein IPJ07_06425 [Acidobacteria bacterium]|nr:hypothetical protein [Acidobacteriota bacterium]
MNSLARDLVSGTVVTDDQRHRCREIEGLTESSSALTMTRGEYFVENAVSTVISDQKIVRK